MIDAAQTAQKKAQKAKRDIIITLILLVVFAFTFTKNVLLQKKRPTLSAGDEAAVDETQGMAEQLIYVTRLRSYDRLRDDQRAVWEKEWARDPFEQQATLATITKAVNLRLEGIFWDEKMPKAVVNEKMLYTGDTIYGYTVVEIKPQSVLMKTGEKTIELRVFRSALGESS